MAHDYGDNPFSDKVAVLLWSLAQEYLLFQYIISYPFGFATKEEPPQIKTRHGTVPRALTEAHPYQ
jgi:hypothetical protein